MRRFLLAVLLCVAAVSVVFGSTPGRSRVVGWGRQASPPCGPYVAISAGPTGSLALRADGTVYAWGSDIPAPYNLACITAIATCSGYNFALKDDGTVFMWSRYYREPVPLPGLSDIAAIDFRETHYLALKSDGTVVSSAAPGYEGMIAPASLSDIMAVSAGTNHCLALKSDGTVVGWGKDEHGQATPPTGLSEVVAVDAGTDVSMALKSDGTVVSWGATLAQEQPAGLSDVTAISAGCDHCLALRSDGTVVGWGSNTYGQSMPPADLTDAIAISAGRRYSLAIRSDGTIVAWGPKGPGTSPPDLSDAVQIAAAYDYALAVKADGTVVKWGNPYPTLPTWLSDVVSISAQESNIVALTSYGTIGLTNLGNPLLSAVVAVSAGRHHCLALMSDRTVIGWGSNEFGQATPPEGLSDVYAISAGWYHSLALKSDGTVASWGSATNVPPGLSDVVSIFAEASCSFAVKSDGSVVTWGYVPFADFPYGITGVRTIDLGANHGLVLKQDGTVIGFGSNIYGEATPPEGLHDVRQIAAGKDYSLALISPNHAPVADAGPDNTVEATGWLTSVTLDAGASSDPDGDPLSYRWMLQRPWNEITDAQCTLQLTMGKHTFSLLVADSFGATCMDSVTITVQDTTPPAFTGVPYDVSLVATSSSGEYFRFHYPTAKDTISGKVTVSCSNLPGSLFPLGTTTVFFTASDAHGNTATATFNVNVTYSCTPLLIPGDRDTIRCGATVPVRYQLTGASAGITDATATLYSAPVTAGGTGSFTRIGTFNYEAESSQYVAKWATKGLQSGNYVLKADLGDGVERTRAVTLQTGKM